MGEFFDKLETRSDDERYSDLSKAIPLQIKNAKENSKAFSKILVDVDPSEISSVEDLTKIEGIEEDTAQALIERSKDFHKKDQEDISKRIKELGLSESLINLKGLTPGMLVTLGEQKILSLEEFADLASDELTGGYDVVKGSKIRIEGYLEDFALSKEEADELIMSARRIVYKD
mgnify:CR=1 FL=1